MAAQNAQIDDKFRWSAIEYDHVAVSYCLVFIISIPYKL